MRIRKLICALVIASAACGGRVVPSRPPISDETRAVRPADWVAGKPNEIAWPKSLSRRQVLITRGWEPEQHYIWYVADGTRLVALFRTANQAELAEAIASFAVESESATAAGLADKRGWAGQGWVPNPPPPGPGPTGEPPVWKLEFIMNQAWIRDVEIVNTKLPKELQSIKQQQRQ